MRIALGVEYDGREFYGWQRQPDMRTVQDCVESALSHVADEPVTIYCAGRTDTGVHATGQVIHFDTDADRPARAWLFGAISKLPKDVTILWSKEVNEDFHARFSAHTRRYRYLIFNSPQRPGILIGCISWHYRPLDVELMSKAAEHLVGKHDFTSFRAMGCQSNTPERTVHHLTVTRKDNLIIIDIKANAFLHHMVRNIAGVLMTIGSKERPVDWVEEVLAGKDRSEGGITAPPYGLYMVEVKYPDHFEIPEAKIGPLFLDE